MNYDGDLRRLTATDRVVGAYLVFSTVPLLFPDRPAGWGGLLLLHAVLALLVLHVPTRDLLLEPLRRRWPTVWRAVRLGYPIPLLPWFYTEVGTLIQTVHNGRFFDDTVQAWERALFGTLPSLTWARDLPVQWVSEVLHGAYLSYYFYVLLPPVVLIAMRRWPDLQRTVFVIAATSLAHYVIYTLFPVQGPRYLFPAPSGGGIENGVLYRATHWVLEGGSSQGSAFPSGHVALSVAVTILFARLYGARVIPMAVVTVLLATATVYGNFHYLTDALAGAVVGGTVGWIGGRRKECPEHDGAARAKARKRDREREPVGAAG